MSKEKELKNKGKLLESKFCCIKFVFYVNIIFSTYWLTILKIMCREMERQRQLEWEKQRSMELQQQRQKEQETVLKLKGKNQTLSIDLQLMVSTKLSI